MIEAFLVGEQEVGARFAGMGPSIRDELRLAVREMSIDVQRLVKEKKLSGQVLGVRTGRGRRSIDQTQVSEGDKAVGIVATRVRYMIAWERGFEGVVTVKAHLRQIKQAFGKPIESTSVSVSQHSRTVKMDKRSFLATGLRDYFNSDRPAKRLRDAADRAVK
jgi:hypothetical protein